MKILLNVKISLYGDRKSVSVWTAHNPVLSGIEDITGIGNTITEALDDFYSSLPDFYMIDKETTLQSEDITYDLVKPYAVEHCDNIVMF